MIPMFLGAAAFLSASTTGAPAARDSRAPVFEAAARPFHEPVPPSDESNAPPPAYTEEERRRLLVEGKDLFFSRTAFGQRPSQGPLVFNQLVSCATCHDPALGFADGLTHPVRPEGEQKISRRQTPHLLGVEHTAPYGWDGRNATLQAQAKGAIISPLEMNAAREPTPRELDALAEFQKTLTVPAAVPGREYDAARAARGAVLFRTPRPVTDPTGEFPSGARLACATCHAGPFFTDNKPHRGLVLTGDPVLDPGEVRPDGTVAGFHTPSLLGLRLTAPFFHNGSGGDPTAPSNFFSGGFGQHSLEGDIGGHGAKVARRALLDNVLPFYNTARFNFGFTDEELADLAEFLLSL
ncbi:MAG TPA: cytochrome c peroxidase [Acidimicrobiia bacterium]|nr:cytochrome c peroxidase [Acidimicrobiia bacterium]